jgi:hypothetical protein
MPILKSKNLSKLIVAEPERPEPVTLMAQVNVTDDLCRMVATSDRDYAVTLIKRELSRQLRDEIMKKCMPFDVEAGLDDFLYRRKPLRMEVTLADRGKYERWLPIEREAGQREGFIDGEKAVRRRLPHGINIDRTEE